MKTKYKIKKLIYILFNFIYFPIGLTLWVTYGIAGLIASMTGDACEFYLFPLRDKIKKLSRKRT